MSEFYQWRDLVLTREEESVLNQENMYELDRAGHLLLRIAHAKGLINESNTECRTLLDRFDTPPHRLNFLVRSGGKHFTQKTVDALNHKIVPGLKCVYFEDDPLYHEYFRATAMCEDRLSALQAHQRKYRVFKKRKDDKDAGKKRKRTMIP